MPSKSGLALRELMDVSIVAIYVTQVEFEN
jgi:hypothetical protein